MKSPFSIHQSVYFALGIVIMKSVSLLMLPIVTKYLSPARFGELEFLLSISDFATILVGFGLVDALYRFAGLSGDSTEEKRIGATIFGLSVLTGVTSLVLGLLVVPFTVSLMPGEITLFDLQLLVFLFSVDACLVVPLAWLKMKDNAFAFFVLTTGKAIIQALVSWQLLKADYGITAMLLGGAISSLLMVIILIKMQYSATGIQIRSDKLKPILIYCWPLVISAIAGYMMLSADRWVITLVSTPEELGLYAVGKKLAMISVILMQPFLMWWLPRRFRVLKEENGPQNVAHNTSLGVALNICFGTLICTGSPIIIAVLIDQSFATAMDYVPALALLYIIKQTAELANIGSYVGNSTKNVMAIDMITAGVSIVGLYFLGYQWQVNGVIAALLIAQVLRMGLFYYTSQRVLPLDYALFKLLLLSILCAALVFVSMQINTVLHHLALNLIAGLVMAAFLHFSGLFQLNFLFNRHKAASATGL